MAKESGDVRDVSENPKISVVNGEVVRIEFKIEELVEALTRRVPSRVMLASCAGCGGCSA